LLGGGGELGGGRLERAARQQRVDVAHLVRVSVSVSVRVRVRVRVRG